MEEFWKDLWSLFEKHCESKKSNRDKITNYVEIAPKGETNIFSTIAEKVPTDFSTWDSDRCDLHAMQDHGNDERGRTSPVNGRKSHA